MPEQLPPFPDLARPAAEATHAPPFEHIVARARRHRRRQVATAVATSAAVVAAVMVGGALTVGGRDAAPPPIEPSPTPTVPRPTPTSADGIIARGGVADFALDDLGNLLTVWSTCLDGSDGGQCEYAWKLSTRNGTWTGVLPPNSGNRVVPANGAFIITAWDGGGTVVAADGSAQPLRRVDRGTLIPGSVLVEFHRELGVAEAKMDTWSPVAAPQGRDLTSGVVSGETIWAQERPTGQEGGDVVGWSQDGRDWHEHAVSGRDTTPGPITASGDHVAASSGRVADDYNPLAVWSTSTDDGDTWSDLPADQLPFHDIDEMAATPGGTLYVHSLRDGLFRSTDGTWRHFERVPGHWLVSVLHTVPSGVAMLQWQHHRPQRIVVLDDAGRSKPVASVG